MEKKSLGAKNVRSQTTSLLFWKFLTERPGGFEQVISAGTKPFFSASFSRHAFFSPIPPGQQHQLEVSCAAASFSSCRFARG